MKSCVLVAAALAVPVVSNAQLPYDAGGFEQPRFNTAITAFAPQAPFLDGQDNPAGGAQGQGPWLKDQVQPTAADALIQNVVFLNGSQAVQFNRAVGEVDTRYGVNKAVSPVGNLTVGWNMRVEDPGAGTGPFFGVEVNDSFDNLINSETNSSILVTALFGVDSETRQLTYQGADGNLVNTNTLVNYGEWNHFQIELNYVNDTYSVVLNGSTVANAIPFVDDNSLAVGGGFTEIDTFTDAPLASLATSFDAFTNSAGTAYYDNYAVVPEPSVAIAGTAVAGLIGLSRRRRSA